MYGQVTQEQLQILKKRANEATQNDWIEPGVREFSSLINNHKEMATVWSCEGHTYGEYLARNNENPEVECEIPSTDKRDVIFVVHGSKYFGFFKVLSDWFETIDSSEFIVCRPELSQLRLQWCFGELATASSSTYTLYQLKFKFKTHDEETHDIMKAAWSRMTEYMKENYFDKLVYTDLTADESYICLYYERGTFYRGGPGPRFESSEQALQWATDNGYFISSYQD